MPVITRVFVKTALIYFILALLAGLLQALPVRLPGIFPVYIHLLALGWITQLIFGIALWMFPKFTREAPRRSDRVSWAVFWLLNLGLMLRVIAEPWHSAGYRLAGNLLVISAVLQWLASLLFVWNVWPRVKEK
jgi:heme/copper-type cytochrome/quinol oxidase subunit 1